MTSCYVARGMLYLACSYNLTVLSSKRSALCMLTYYVKIVCLKLEMSLLGKIVCVHNNCICVVADFA